MKHQEIIELLPWYVNATLSQPERELIREHLANGCGECAREIESLTAMRQAVVALGDEEPAPSPLLLNRALAQIEDYERKQVPDRRKTVPFRERIKAWWPPAPVFLRAALATQLAIIVALGTVAMYQHNHPQKIYIYNASSGPSGDPTRANISVMFNPNATEHEISRTIGGIHGIIVAGPTAQGLYTVQLPLRPEQTPEIEQALQTLQQDRSVVRVAMEKK
jgi:hypothetical protein